MFAKMSVKKPYTVLVAVVLVIVLGVVSLMKMTTDLLPNISLPYVVVMTTYVGASPETVETVVTRPVESSMATVSNIEGITSVSAENYSMVIMEFSQSTNMDSVSLEIREMLDQISGYWDDSIGSPIIMKLNPDMLPIMIAAVGKDGMDQGQVSTYVQETIMPELESIEGVASVSASGLLEESVNVIIRQESIDELNVKIQAAIDEEMKEAEQELADGLKEIEDGKKEIADGRQEIIDGQKELADKKQELEDGKDEFNEGKGEAADGFAEGKSQLLTAKSNLEAAKINMTTSLQTAKMLDTNIKQVALLRDGDTAAKYGEYVTNIAMVSGGDAGVAEYRSKIAEIKSAVYENAIVTATMGELAKSTDPTAVYLYGLYTDLKGVDWADATNATDVAVLIGGVGGTLNAGSALIDPQIANMEAALNAETSGVGLAAYEEMVKTQIAEMDKNLATVNSNLEYLEKLQLETAIQMGGASAGIASGEAQIEQAEKQLESALEQLEDGEKSLEDALEQINEGKEQLEEARQDAYAAADANSIITIDTIKNLLVAQNFSMPAGYVTEEGIEYLVRVGDKPETIEEMSAMPLLNLNMDGVPVITLGDVADVFYTDNSAELYTNVNGSSGCMLTIQKQTGYSTGEVSDLLLEKFDELMETEEGLSILTLMDQGIFIDLVMDSIVGNLGWGFLLAVLILLVFLKDLRPTFVIACSIPISLITAIVCMYFSGVTLNVISLSGLALGVGMLVDNSIVVIENIYRLRSEGASMKEAAIEGTKEVAGAIVASTLTTVCVFLPIVFTEGITRQLFVDMGLTIGYSLGASLVVALTVVPAMASKTLTKTKDNSEGKVFRVIINGYGKLIDMALHAKSLVIILSLALLVVSFAVAWRNGVAFMPEMDSPQMTVTVEMLADDANLEDTRRVSNEVVDVLLAIPEVSDVGAMSSQDSMASMTGGGNASTTSSTIYVVLHEDKKLTNEAIADIIEEKTAHITEAEISIETAMMDMSALGGSGVTIQVRGRDLDKLQTMAKEVATIVESVEGTKDVSNGLQEANEELRIVIDRDKAIENGLTVAQVFTQIAAKLADASNATTLVAADADYNVYVSHELDDALTRDLVKDLMVDGTDEDGKTVKIPLAGIAEFETAYSLDTINRAEQNRYISVTAGIADGYNVGKVSTQIEKALENYEVPTGYSLVFAGENETIMEAMEQLMLMLLLAVIFMYLIMVAQFQSLLSPFIIMFTLPLAFTGGFFGLAIGGSEISVIAMIGFIMLAGVIVNNGIVLVDYMNLLRERGMEKREAIIEAGKTRLRPVLMTALTTILAMSTMVFSNDMGGELGKPMAVVTVGGLAYGTLLTLFIIPCVYDIFTGGKKRPKKAAQLAVESEE